MQRFEPAPGPRNFLSVAGGRTDGEWTWGAGVMFDYQRAPLVLQSCASSTDCSAPDANVSDTLVIRDMLTWNVLGSITPIPRLQIGLRVPVAYTAGDGVDLTDGGPSASGINAIGVGDVALEGKVRMVGDPSDTFVLAAAIGAAAPTGHLSAAGNYLGQDTPITAGGRIIADIQVDDFRAALNVGGVYRSEARLGDTPIGSEFRYGAAVGYRVHEMIGLFAETFGASRFSIQNGTNPLEINGGVRLLLLHQRLQIRAAGGTGIISGIGVPSARAIVGISFFYDDDQDQDGDGIADDFDQCPTKAEDIDQIADDDGCPEQDFDHDKLLDEDDMCPFEPETENNYKDDDGCPDEAKDSDGDGVLDEADKCPTQAGKLQRADFLGCPDSDGDGVPDKIDLCNGEKEDTDGYKDTDGCPDPDNDGDGVLDIADECADAAENINGVMDGDGCPDYGPDQDDDGVPDAQDQCVDKAETLNGIDDADGCPDKPPLARVTPEGIEVLVPLPFAGEAITQPMALDALRAVANGLRNWPQIMQVEVVVGSPGADGKLAAARANGIVARLRGFGVNAARLVTKPLVSDTPSVAFKVVQAAERPAKP